MAEYKCLNKLMKDDVAQANAESECAQEWLAVRIAAGGDLCPVAM